MFPFTMAISAWFEDLCGKRKRDGSQQSSKIQTCCCRPLSLYLRVSPVVFHDNRFAPSVPDNLRDPDFPGVPGHPVLLPERFTATNHLIVQFAPSAFRISVPPIFPVIRTLSRTADWHHPHYANFTTIVVKGQYLCSNKIGDLKQREIT